MLIPPVASNIESHQWASINKPNKTFHLQQATYRIGISKKNEELPYDNDPQNYHAVPKLDLLRDTSTSLDQMDAADLFEKSRV